MAKFKQMPVEQLYAQIDGLKTSEQIELQKFIDKILADKRTQAEAEVNLINGKKP